MNGDEYLTTEEAPLLALLARTPELEVIFSRIIQIQDTFLAREGRNIDVNREPVGGSSIITEQDEPPACIRWDRGD